MDRRELLIAGGSASTLAAFALAAPATAHGAASPASGVSHGFHATMSAQPGKGDDLVALLLRAPAFETPDCLVFLVGRSASDRDKIFVTEGWTSQEAHGRFFDSDVAKAYIATLPGPPRSVSPPIGKRMRSTSWSSGSDRSCMCGGAHAAS